MVDSHNVSPRELEMEWGMRCQHFLVLYYLHPLIYDAVNIYYTNADNEVYHN